MEISLHYGHEQKTLYLPSENLADWIVPWPQNATTHADSLVNLASRPEAKDFVRQIRGRHLCVLLPDGTRDFPWNAVLGPLFDLFGNAGHITFMLCSGTHTADTRENKVILEKVIGQVRRIGLFSYDTFIHDCQSAEFIDAGQTAGGTPVLYNAALQPADIFLVLSDVKFHYFAGYSNPIKNFLPGVCAFETAEKNHSLTFDARCRFGVHPWHPDPERTDQPLAADQLEGMEKIVAGRPVWAAVTISTKGKLHWAHFGPVCEVTAQAFAMVDKGTEHHVAPADRMVISPGGHPDDIDLYIAQRALELTKAAINDGGEILFLSACPDGIGAKRTMEHIYNKLTCPLDEILTEKPEQYQLYSHKPYRFAQLISRLRRLWIHTQLDDKTVRAIHMEPAKDPQDVINQWIDENPLVKILFVDGANKLALQVKP